MRGGALPPGLLFAALALALAFAPKARLAAVGAALFVALAVVWLRVAGAAGDIAFIGCWASLVITAVSVHLPRGLGPRTAVVLGANAGVWSGAVVAAAGEPLDLAKAALALALCPVAVWAVRHKAAIAVKTVAAWLIAVGILVATLPVLATPGYVADHMQ